MLKFPNFSNLKFHYNKFIMDENWGLLWRNKWVLQVASDTRIMQIYWIPSCQEWITKIKYTILNSFMSRVDYKDQMYNTIIYLRSYKVILWREVEEIVSLLTIALENASRKTTSIWIRVTTCLFRNSQRKLDLVTSIE